jgi:hypothetical protein
MARGKAGVGVQGLGSNDTRPAAQPCGGNHRRIVGGKGQGGDEHGAPRPARDVLTKRLLADTPGNARVRPWTRRLEQAVEQPR